MKYLRYKGTGKSYSDCTSDQIYEVIGNPTVRELCDYIVKTKTEEWGYIGIYDNKSVFGNPSIEYSDGSYVDKNGNPIEFNIQDDIANKIVKDVKASGGWSRMDYLFIL